MDYQNKTHWLVWRRNRKETMCGFSLSGWRAEKWPVTGDPLKVTCRRCTATMEKKGVRHQYLPEGHKLWVHRTDETTTHLRWEGTTLCDAGHGSASAMVTTANSNAVTCGPCLRQMREMGYGRIAAAFPRKPQPEEENMLNGNEASAGLVPGRKAESLIARLNYCRSFLYVHGLLTENQSGHIKARVEDVANRLAQEEMPLGAGEEVTA